MSRIDAICIIEGTWKGLPWRRNHARADPESNGLWEPWWFSNRETEISLTLPEPHIPVVIRSLLPLEGCRHSQPYSVVRKKKRNGASEADVHG